MAQTITRGSHSWRLVFGALIALIVSGGPLVQFSFAVFLDPVSRSLNVDRASASLALAAGTLGIAAATPVCGMLVDRFGSKIVAAIGAALTGTLFVALSYAAGTLVIFLSFYVLAGLAAAGYSPLAFARAIAISFDRRRGLALGIAMAGVGLGTAILPQVSQALIAGYGWQSAYRVLGLGVIAVALPAILLTMPGDFRREARRDNEPGLTLREALGTAQFWLIAGTFTWIALACSGVMAHVVAMLTDMGVAPTVAAGGLSVGGIALVAGRILSGWLSDRFHASRVALGFFLGPLVGVILLAYVQHPGAAIAAAGLVGLGLGAEVDLIAFLICRYFGLRAMGTIYSVIFTIFMIASSLGPYLMGMSYRLTGSYQTALQVFVVGVACSCLGITKLGAYRFPSAAD